MGDIILSGSSGSSGGGGAVTIADGADVTEGTIADAAVTGDNPGTISGKLRGLVKIITDVWDSVNHRLKVDGSGVTQPISGAISFTAPQHVIADSGTVNVGTVTTLPAITFASPQHTIVDSGTLTAVTAITNPLPAGTNVLGHVIVDSGAITSTVTNDGTFAKETGGNLATLAGTVTAARAAVNPISGQAGVAGGTGTDSALTQRVSLATNVALPAGSNVIGHVIADTGSTTAVTGNITVIQGTGTNLHAVLDSGSTTAVTQATGTNLHAVLDSGTLTTVSTVTSVTGATINNAGGASAVNVQDGGNSITVDGTITGIATSTSRSDTYTTTGNGVTITATANPFKAYAIQVVGQGTLASIWDVRLEGSLDNTNFDQILQHTNTTGDGKVVFSGSLLAPSLYFRSRCAGLTLGTATGIAVTIVGIQ